MAESQAASVMPPHSTSTSEVDLIVIGVVPRRVYVRPAPGA
jgi:hypothetical protein